MSTPAAGWYDDGQGQQRYWDGVQWTEHVAPLAPVPGAAQQQAAVAAVPAQGTFAAPSAPQAPGALGAPSPTIAGVAPIAQGPYPPAPPAPRSSLKVLWIALIVVGGVVVIGAIVAVSLLLFLPRSSPDQTVRDYNSAWHDGNCDAIERLTTQSWKSTYAFDCSSVVAAPGPAWKVSFLSLDQSSDVALVEYTVSGKGASGQSFSQTYDARLVHDGGTWLIDSDELVSSE